MAREKTDANAIQDQKQSIFHSLVRSDMPESEKSATRLSSEAFLLLGAGTATTGATLTIITYYALADRAIEGRLRKELRQISSGDLDKMPRWAELEKCSYLVACIKEGLRYVA